MTPTDAPTLRPATPADVPSLRRLTEESFRGLCEGYYTAPQVESALRHVLGPDTRPVSFVMRQPAVAQ